MRDLVFKNLTSLSKKRRVVSSSEVTDRDGVRSIIHRHFICMVREMEHGPVDKPKPYLYVLKERNSLEQKEKFFCRIKGGLFVIHEGKLYQISFMHSLKIYLAATTFHQPILPEG